MLCHKILAFGQRLRVFGTFGNQLNGKQKECSICFPLTYQKQVLRKSKLLEANGTFQTLPITFKNQVLTKASNLKQMVKIPFTDHENVYDTFKTCFHKQ